MRARSHVCRRGRSSLLLISMIEALPRACLADGARGDFGFGDARGWSSMDRLSNICSPAAFLRMPRSLEASRNLPPSHAAAPRGWPHLTDISRGFVDWLRFENGLASPRARPARFQEGFRFVAPVFTDLPRGD